MTGRQLSSRSLALSSAAYHRHFSCKYAGILLSSRASVPSPSYRRVIVAISFLSSRYRRAIVAELASRGEGGADQMPDMSGMPWGIVD